MTFHRSARFAAIARARGSLFLLGLPLWTACSNEDGPIPKIFTDAGNLGALSGGNQPITNDAGQSLKPWPPPGVSCASSPCPDDPGSQNIYVTISGESNALVGYPFPPNNWGTDTYFVDGWDFIITEYIVTVDKVTLWSNPNHNPSNQGSLTGMTQVAHLDGPFVVDLHKGGPIPGQGGAPEEATPIGVLTAQNDNGNAPFDPTTTYGFGFSTVPATYDAYNVNLTQDESADFERMVENGYSVFYRGHLSWKGNSAPNGCTSTQAGPGPDAGVEDADAGLVTALADGGYDYSKMPNSGIDLAFGFATPTDYINCQNMALQGLPNPGEDYPRGLQVSTSQSVVAQVTVHMDHPFWESFAENSPVHFDGIAAQYVGETDPVATLEDMKGVPFYAFTDRTGTPLPWRSCSPTYTPPGNGQMVFDTLSVPVNPHGVCIGTVGQPSESDHCPAIRDYYDYLRFTQSTQGHMNSQGLCFVQRRFPAPPGGS